jgi:hypothetical protein
MTNGSNRYPDTIEWASFLPYAGPIVIEKTWKWVPKTVMETETIENARDATPLTSIMKQKVPPRCGFFSHAITIFSPARRKHEQGHGLAPSYVVDRKCFKKLLRPNFLRQLSEFQWRKLRRKSCVPFGLETVARTDVSSANVNNSSNTIPLTQTQFTFFPMNRWLESWCY